MSDPTIHATTVVAVRHRGRVAMAGDGQVSLGQTILKHTARKVRRVHQDRVLAGFAGTAADAFTLFERFEARLEEHRGNLRRAAVELAKEWRSDRVLRRLEALLAVADRDASFLVSGTGEVIEPDDGLHRDRLGRPVRPGGRPGAGGALRRSTPRRSPLEAMRVAAGICVYTNDQITVEEL